MGSSANCVDPNEKRWEDVTKYSRSSRASEVIARSVKFSVHPHTQTSAALRRWLHAKLYQMDVVNSSLQVYLCALQNVTCRQLMKLCCTPTKRDDSVPVRKASAQRSGWNDGINILRTGFVWFFNRPATAMVLLENALKHTLFND